MNYGYKWHQNPLPIYTTALSPFRRLWIYIYQQCKHVFLPFHTVRSSFWRLPLLWLLRVLQQISSLSWWPSTRQEMANLQLKKSQRRFLLGLSIKRGKINRTFSDIWMIISSDNLISIHLFLYFLFPHQHRECNRLGSYFLCAISLTEFYYEQVLCKGATLGLCHMKNQVLSTTQVENLTWKCSFYWDFSSNPNALHQKKNLINRVV